MKKEIKNKGITLIALVITIIILLILAGVTIQTLTGDNGLITKAQSAKEKVNEEEIEEQIKLAQLEYQTTKYTNTAKTEAEYMQEILNKVFDEEVLVTKSGRNYKVKIGNGKTVYKVKKNGDILKYEEMDTTSVYGKLDKDNNILYLRAIYQEGYTDTTNSVLSNFFNKDNIKKVIIEEKIAPRMISFSGFDNLEEIKNIKNLHTENITSMDSMFSTCKKLKKLDLSEFDTSNVTTMKTMFNWPISLEEIDLSNFDTSNVTSMKYMFSGCQALKRLIISEDFVINEGVDYFGMFENANRNMKIVTTKNNIKRLKEVNPNFTDENFEMIN